MVALRKAFALDFVCEEPTGTTVLPIEGPDHDPAEVLMHVRTSPTSTVWHKRINGLGRTACGEVIDHQTGARMRHEVLEGQLCPKCFTEYERELAAKTNLKNLKDVT
jgi:hypothetical protein